MRARLLARYVVIGAALFAAARSVWLRGAG